MTGSGTATPQGVKFPGGYKPDEPGFHFNLSSNQPFPPVGPPLYQSKIQVDLPAKEQTVISPTGKGEEADKAYYQTQYQVLQQQGGMTSYFDSIGG